MKEPALESIGGHKSGTLRSECSCVLCKVKIGVVTSQFPLTQQNPIAKAHIPRGLVWCARNGFTTNMEQVLPAEVFSEAKLEACDPKVTLVTPGIEISMKKGLRETDIVKSISAGDSKMRSSEPADHFSVNSLSVISVRIVLA